MFGVIYQNEKIIKSMQVPGIETLEANCGEGEDYLVTDESVSVAEYWVSDSKLMSITAFPELQYVSSVQMGDTIQIKRIPGSTTVVWPDGFISIEQDGELSTIATIAQPMVFSLYNDRHHRLEVTINVTP